MADVVKNAQYSTEERESIKDAQTDFVYLLFECSLYFLFFFDLLPLILTSRPLTLSGPFQLSSELCLIVCLLSIEPFLGNISKEAW